MAEIGSLVVDLTLKSAKFINDLNKSSQAVAKNTASMQTSMTGLEKSIGRAGAAFEAWLTVRTLRQIERLTQASLEFAATLEGPLGDSARKFQNQFEELQNHFKAGLTIGFLDQVQQGFLTTEKAIKAIDDASVALGKTLGAIFQDISQFLLIDVPQFMTSIQAFGHDILVAAQGPLPKWLAWIDALNDGLAAAINKGLQLIGVAARVPTIQEAQSTLVSPDTSAANDAATSSVAKLASNFQLLADAQLRARMETIEFWNATVSTTATGQEMLDMNEAQLKLYADILSPMEQYRLKLEAIRLAQFDNTTATRLQTKAQIDLVATYLDGVEQATGALASAFKENKAIQIANAVVNTAAGVAKALGDPKLPFPLDFAVAASIAAAGAAQIATILSAQPGSAGRSSGHSKAISSSESSAPAPAQAGEASTAAAPVTTTTRQAVNITLVGSGGFGREQVRALIAEINDAVGDGAELRVAG